MSGSSKKSNWVLPNEVMQLQKLRKKKKALQARIQSSPTSKPLVTGQNPFVNIEASKRKNPFQIGDTIKKIKNDDMSLVSPLEESSDQTLFKLIHLSDNIKNYGKENVTSFKNVLSNIENVNTDDNVEIVKNDGETWVPIDWSLKTKIKFLSRKPFPFNHKLKISEEASGVTSFTRCLDITNSTSSLDASIKSKFHQCCLYWQQPYLPWMELFPRNRTKTANISSIATNATIKDGFRNAYADSLRSLFHLIRTKQCCYFYLRTNHYTILFRAAGMCGFSEIHALVAPTTRGFRQILKKKDIEFTMPLKKHRQSDQNISDNMENDKEENGEQHESSEEEWLESMGIGHEDIKQINYTQEKINYKLECSGDNNEQSLVLIEGVEVQALYNLLINCKRAVPTTGPYAGIPPTLLAPVAFHGATLCSLKVNESKAHLDNEDYYSLELAGPILPHTVHNVCDILPKEQSFTITHANLINTLPFSRVTSSCSKSKDSDVEGSLVFRQENLSDCGLKPNVLKYFCSDDDKYIVNVDCLKYTSDSMTYSWT